MIGTTPKNMIQYSLKSEEQPIELTSLMDVIFILLIFFILTSGITQVSTEVALTKTNEVLETSTNDNTVLIELLQSDVSWKINDEAIESEMALHSKILEKFQENPEHAFIIAPERTLPAERLIQLLNFLSANQIQNVQILSQWEP